MSKSKTAAAADKALAKAAKKNQQEVQLTPEQAIEHIAKLLESGLSVPTDRIKTLLEQYHITVDKLASAQVTIEGLKKAWAVPVSADLIEVHLHEVHRLDDDGAPHYAEG